MGDVQNETGTFCPVCMGDYKKPRILPCDHVLCLECARGCAAAGTSKDSGLITCPMCKTPAELKADDLTMKYELCSDELKHVSGQCDSHKKECFAVCEACHVEICTECILTSHRGHAAVPYEDYLKSKALSLADKFKDLQVEQKSCEDEKKMLLEDYEKCKSRTVKLRNLRYLADKIKAKNGVSLAALKLFTTDYDDLLRKPEDVHKAVKQKVMHTTSHSSNFADSSDLQSDGHIRFVASGVSRWKDGARNLSDPVMIRNMPWRILLMARPPITTGAGRSLSFYVQCNEGNDSPSWSICASVELCLINQLDPSKNFPIKFTCALYANRNDRGIPEFLQMKELLDPSEGWTKNNKLIAECKIHAEPLHDVDWNSKHFTGSGASGHIICAVSGISGWKHKECKYSDPLTIGGLPWRILLIHSAPKGSDECLEFYVQCDWENESPSWRVHAKAQLTMINHFYLTKRTTKDLETSIFSAKNNARGNRGFHVWKGQKSPSAGWVKGDEILVECVIHTEGP